MLYRRKTVTKDKKNADIHEQLVRLSKENQYLHTKLDCYEQQIENLNNLKDKYKHKYKQIKTQLAYTLTSEEELMGLRDELPTRKKIFKDDNPYSLKIPDKK